MTRKQRVLAYLRRWAPMPFTAVDVSDELRMYHRSVQTFLSELVQEGAIARKPDPDMKQGVLYYYAANELEEAA